MKNADMPANAQSFAMTENECGTPLDFMNETKKYTGLTKREMIAMHAMQGLIASNSLYGGKGDREALARDAIAHADALLQELAK